MIKEAQDHLETMRWDEGEGNGRGSDTYGGVGYGGRNSRPDLSNSALMIEALRDTGPPPDDLALLALSYARSKSGIAAAVKAGPSDGQYVSRFQGTVQWARIPKREPVIRPWTGPAALRERPVPLRDHPRDESRRLDSCV